MDCIHSQVGRQAVQGERRQLQYNELDIEPPATTKPEISSNLIVLCQQNFNNVIFISTRVRQDTKESRQKCGMILRTMLNIIPKKIFFQNHPPLSPQHKKVALFPPKNFPHSTISTFQQLAKPAGVTSQMGHVMQVGVGARTVPERVWPRGADNAKPASGWSASLASPTHTGGGAS